MNETNKYAIFFIVVCCLVMAPQVYWRQQNLNENGVKGVGKLLEISNLPKGKIKATVEYDVKGEKFSFRPPAFPETQIGSCYEITYIPNSPKTVEVNFKKQVPCN